ncbi:uncharacterized protein LOC116339840 [Contarinia nasturtii]|uniref:uncharacterized protein LOC116339840 n=1 Tax=Contarinia nasturtii TaxID=265458 RepID=UPI0012D41608|nr:uncharacterized protein LOC116339840 [Contarinia nasturtii]
MPALRYTLEWIYQFVIFQDETHFIFRQCASALIALLATSNSIHSLSDKLGLCFSKWFSMATQYGNLELSQVVLLATCLNAIKIPDAFRDFLTPYLSNFLASSSYQNMCISLSKTSGLFSSYRFRQQDHKPLPHLNSIVYNTQNTPVFIVSDRPTIYFISSLVRFYNNTKWPDKGSWLNDGILKYIEQFSHNTEFKLSFNWFLRHEILFVLDLLKSTLMQQKLDKSIQLQIAYKVLICLTELQINEVLHIFSQFIFNIDMYAQNMNLTVETMDKLKSTYGKLCVECYLNNANSQVKIENFDRIPLLSSDWPGMLLLKLYQTPDDGEDWLYLPEKETIWTTITFLSLLNSNNIKVLSPTEQFVYTMIAFLGKENVFLESDMKTLLANFVQLTFKSQQPLNFNSKFSGKFNFENLYISFLDQFQGSSYGDNTFSRLVMAPLAQKHNIKWRQMIWSEHVHVLRFVTCTEDELIGELNDYLEPPETDVLLIKSYFQAINSNCLLPNSAPFRIAQHHYNMYKAKTSQDTPNAMET